MDNDSGWAAREITLTPREREGQPDPLTLRCRWVELAQVWDGQAGSYFLVSGVEASRLTDGPWAFLSFRDSAGKAHRFAIGTVRQVDPQAIRLTKGD